MSVKACIPSKTILRNNTKIDLCGRDVSHGDTKKVLYMFLIACTMGVDEAVMDGLVNGGGAGMVNMA